MIVVGSLILIGESRVASIAYALGCAMEITKLVSCEEVSLRRWEMMYAPSGVGSSGGGALSASDVVMAIEERNVIAISMPFVRASRRYPCAMLWLCADMEGNGKDVCYCTRIAVRHHGAQWVSPLRLVRRRGGRMRYLVVLDGVSGWVRYRANGMDCRRMGL